MKWQISPLNDFIFKKVFGTIGNEELLKSFLNAIMKDKNLPLIKEITIIEKLDLNKDYLEEKLGIIDIHAKTEKGGVINIGVQIGMSIIYISSVKFFTPKKLLTLL